jgi:hypothetical protein
VVDNEKSAPGMRRFDDPRDLPLESLELEKEDVMKFKPIYEAIHMFMMEDGFRHPVSNDDKVEELYWERWIPSGAKEQHIWWRWAKKASPYLRYYVEINFQTLNVSKAEVAYRNRKISGEKIDLIIRIRPVLQWDYDNKLRDSIIEQFKKTFFAKIYNEEIRQRRAELQDTMERLQRLIRGYFEMVSEQPAPMIHQPPMGYKERF